MRRVVLSCRAPKPRALRISYTCPRAQLDSGLQRIKEFFAELTEAKQVAAARA